MLIKNQFGLPESLGFDPAGRLFVLDDYGDSSTSYGRILVFATPNSLPSGSGSADRVMGVVPTGELTTLGLTGQPAQTFALQTFTNQPKGIFFLPDGSVGILDTGDHRILVFPSYDKWPPEATNYSPLASYSVGQGGSFLSVYPNNAQTANIANGTPPASGSTLSSPVAAAFLPSTNELFVADTGNNRVAVLPYSGGAFHSATRVLARIEPIPIPPISSKARVSVRDFDHLWNVGRRGDRARYHGARRPTYTFPTRTTIGYWVITTPVW